MKIEKKSSFQPLLFGTVFLLYALYFARFFIWGEDCIIRQHDNLDGDFVYRVVLENSGKVLTADPFEKIPQVMTGLPRLCMPSGISVFSFFMAILPPFWAYVFNYMLIHLVGFFSMYFFLRVTWFTNESEKVIAVAAAFSYSLLPVFIVTGISVMGIPGLALVFLRASMKKAGWLDALFIIFYATYAFFNMFPFVIGAAILFLGIDFLKRRSVNLQLIMVFFLLLISFICVEYQLFYGIVIKGFEAHRNSFEMNTVLNAKGLLLVSFMTLGTGVYHSAQYPGFLILVISILILFYGFKENEYVKKAVLLFALAGIAAFLATLSQWFGFQWVFDRFKFFNVFNISRFHYFLPFLVYAAWFLCLKILAEKKVQKAFIILSMLPVLAHSVYLNYANDHFDGSEISYKEFFSNDVFEDLSIFIDRPKDSYRVGCIGFYPSIAQYNGFHTIDSYQNNYPLAYKIKFMEIMKPEFAKMPLFEKSFRTGGASNRCFLHSSEILESNKVFGSPKDTLQQMALDLTSLQDLGCNYLISANPIREFSSSHIRFLRSFSRPNSPYVLHLFEVGKEN